MNEQYSILFLRGVAESVDYKPLGFGSSPKVPNRNRRQHGSRLISTFRKIWELAENIKNGRVAMALPVKSGSYIEFKGLPGFNLVTKSLEDARAGIKLLNIREEYQGDEKILFATVFIPNGKENYFIKKLRKYVSEIDKRSELPKNYYLVNSIEDVRLAVLESFWTDDLSQIPDQDNEKFCELWLRSSNETEGTEINEIQEICELFSISIVENRTLFFPERIVCLIKANRGQLLELVEASSNIAEIRIAREATGFIVEEPNISQIQWVQELQSRIRVNDDEIGVCILDTGVNNGHPLLAPVLRDDDCDSYDPAWGVADDTGHGTLMAGVSVYGDLSDALQSNELISLDHRLSSVKILPPRGENDPDMYGAITQQAISTAEINAPHREQIFCCATTTPNLDTKGKPTSWSAAIDSITSGQVDGEKRLFIISAGNVRNVEEWNSYPGSNLISSIEDPAQSWNALSVGGYTEKVIIGDRAFANHSALAPLRGLSPYSRCSLLWRDSKWPIKPDIVVEAGNLRRAPDGGLFENFPDLSVLSTSADIINNQFDVIAATSAAAGKAAWIAAKIKHKYQRAWPETIKGLMAHSAEWPDSIINQFGFDVNQKRGVQDLMRVCGFGVPNLEKALFCDSTVLTLVSEEHIQPFRFDSKNRPTSNDMHLYEMPWPKNELLQMGELEVKLRITLCYFIEPAPGEIGWKDKYRYASHGLRFEVNNVNDTKDEFIKRINVASREEDETPPGDSGADRWIIGANNRALGSIHSDIWEGTAADIASCNMVAVYPVIGWWRERKHLGNVLKGTRYSLIVSLITPPQDIDIYQPVESQIRVPIEIRT